MFLWYSYSLSKLDEKPRVLRPRPAQPSHHAGESTWGWALALFLDLPRLRKQAGVLLNEMASDPALGLFAFLRECLSVFVF